MSPLVEDDDEARAVAERYARRDPRADARRYGLFDAAALQAQQERLRAMVALWRAHGWADLTGRDLLEVGCGAGGNLLDLLRLGAEPGRLAGIELQADRVVAARAVLPSAVRLIEGDATRAHVAPESQDAVLLFTVFSSLLDDATRQRLAATIWRWVRPGGGVLHYDFAVDNPRNADVRGVSTAQVRALFPQARCTVRRLTLAPPLARAAARLHAGLPAWTNAVLPLLRTHRMAWLVKDR
ncbi:class I SAM-dependent methyltransferase [Methylibium sp. Root1272]|uniref:class I SAM-dependent methyltransferase n=1 Tax=Methylibium sp. Root1272 TaxID=1736441 RepID=UPI0007003713|nr:class I SAM-dependent methyltransferase [Methylibium sp. Root1272]KQW65753.1 methyltransferase type 11 [Methylibium sp. Root1272]